MPNLIIMRDQTGATGKDIIPLQDNITPTDALMIYFPQGINPESVHIYVSGKRMVLPSESENPSIELLQPLTHDMVVVMEVKALGTYGAYYLFAAALIASIVLAPKIPGDVGQTKNSPNNDLQGQTNIARPYQAYPLVFGSPVVYPDLTGEPIVEYINNQKIVRQLMVVGDGLFDIEETRAGATPYSNFSSASATYYEPASKVVTVPEEINVFATNEIDGQELLGTSNNVIDAEYNLTENGTGLTTLLGKTFTFQVIKDTESDTLLADFNASTGLFRYTVKYKCTIDEFVGIEDVSGTGYLQSVTLDGSGTFYTVLLSSFNGPTALDAIYSFDTPFLTQKSANSKYGPIKIAVETDEIWINFNFLRGLKSTVGINLSFEKLDGPNGDPIIGPSPDFYDIEYTDDTLEQQFRTHKRVLLGGKGYYQVTFTRLDVGTNDANEPDQTTIEAVYAVNREVNVQHGNLTLLDISMPATINATSLRENKINLSLTSKLITYENGAVNYTPRASRKMADAILHLTVEFFGRSPDTLALDELYEIQNRLDEIDPRLATFDFTFDDIDVSYDERMDAILQVARCYKWLDGDVYRFARNEKRDHESTVINRRDIASSDNREYGYTYNPQLLENYDSVKVEYVNKETNKKSYIFRTIDDSGNVIDGVGRNPKSLQLAGCSEEYNAINRAELELRTLIYQRETVTDTLEPSAMFLDKGDMVLYAEQYDIDNNVFDGEILSVNGNIATTSGEITFEPGVDYVVNYTTEDGSSVGPFDISPVVNEPFKFQCLALTDIYVRDSVLGFKVQTGSRYIISTVDNLDASRWTVIDKEVRGRNVQLTMVNYDERIYEYDEV